MGRRGALLRRRYRRALHDPSRSVDTAYLGYWTDNGAYYYGDANPHRHRPTARPPGRAECQVHIVRSTCVSADEFSHAYSIGLPRESPDTLPSTSLR